MTPEERHLCASTSKTPFASCTSADTPSFAPREIRRAEKIRSNFPSTFACRLPLYRHPHRRCAPGVHDDESERCRTGAVARHAVAARCGRCIVFPESYRFSPAPADAARVVGMTRAQVVADTLGNVRRDPVTAWPDWIAELPPTRAQPSADARHAARRAARAQRSVRCAARGVGQRDDRHAVAAHRAHDAVLAWAFHVGAGQGALPADDGGAERAVSPRGARQLRRAAACGREGSGDAAIPRWREQSQGARTRISRAR